MSLSVTSSVAVRFPIEVFEDEPIVNSSFTVLTDTPANYVDQAGKLAAVNSTETGVGFIDAPTSLPSGGTTGQVLTKNSTTEGDAGWGDVVSSFVGLSDTPNSYIGKGGKFVKVTTTATGLEFGDVPESGGSSDSSSSTKAFMYTHLEGGL